MWNNVSTYRNKLAAQRQKKERKVKASLFLALFFSPAVPIPLAELSMSYGNVVITSVALTSACSVLYTMPLLIVLAQPFISPAVSVCADPDIDTYVHHCVIPDLFLPFPIWLVIAGPEGIVSPHLLIRSLLLSGSTCLTDPVSFWWQCSPSGFPCLAGSSGSPN